MITALEGPSATWSQCESSVCVIMHQDRALHSFVCIDISFNKRFSFLDMVLNVESKVSFCSGGFVRSAMSSQN